ncbi:hypothetical protein B5J92_05305 [Moraxella atlantae]|nr:hypothetical protein B5J92_05305 [Moraxella atlantae]
MHITCQLGHGGFLAVNVTIFVSWVTKIVSWVTKIYHLGGGMPFFTNKICHRVTKFVTSAAKIWQVVTLFGIN